MFAGFRSEVANSHHRETVRGGLAVDTLNGVNVSCPLPRETVVWNATAGTFSSWQFVGLTVQDSLKLNKLLQTIPSLAVNVDLPPRACRFGVATVLEGVGKKLRSRWYHGMLFLFFCHHVSL